MRQFLVFGHEAPTTPGFSLDNLGGAGRLDLLARAVNAAVFLSHDMRDDVRLYLIFDDTVTLRIESAELRYMSPDERSIAGLLRSALETRMELDDGEERQSTPGIYVSNRTTASVLRELAATTTLIHLHEDGESVTDIAVPTEPTVVLSDHQEVTDNEQALLGELADHRVRLGPEILHTDHAIAITNHWLDTGGFDRF